MRLALGERLSEQPPGAQMAFQAIAMPARLGRSGNTRLKKRKPMGAITRETGPMLVIFA
jgi:hypothetical protein